MKNTWLCFALLSLAATHSIQAAQSTTQPTAQAAAKPVRVEAVKTLDVLPTTDVLGTISSKNRVALTAGIAGKLEWVLEPGNYVKSGDIIARVDTVPIKLQQAEQQAQINRAKINVNYLQRELKRQKQLRQQNNTSIFQLEQTESQFDLAKSDLEIAQLKLEQVNEQLSRAEIRSPFSGIITERLKRAGADVNRSDVIVNLLDTESLEVRAFVPIRYLTKVKPGVKVQLMSSEEPQNPIFAHANTIIPAADPRSQTFEVRINIPDEGLQYWTSGQLIKVSIPLASQMSALSVHRDALILRRDGTYVVKVDKNNQIKRLKVKVGKGSRSWVSITTSELKEGDRVVTRGAERLRDGDRVSIQNT